MQQPPNDILLITTRVSPSDLVQLVERFFGDMVKYVVDIEREIIAIGGQLHADAEALLLADGSRQNDLWGANYYPGRGRDDCIEYTSMINIRPAQGNHGMEVGDATVRERIAALTFALMGTGEAI